MSIQDVVNSLYSTNVKNNRTYEVKLNRNSDEIFLIHASSEEHAVNQISLLIAINQLIGSGFDFDKWADEFESCYPTLTTGYTADKPWGLPVDQRPKITVIERGKDGSITVVFKPNREKEDRLIFKGDKKTVRQNIELSMQIGGKSTESPDDGFDFKEWVERFEECYPGLPTGHDSDEPWGEDKNNRPKIYIIKIDKDTDDMVVKFYPRRKETDNYIILEGDKHRLRQSIQETFYSFLNLDGKDIGINAYYPLDEYLRAKPRDYLSLQIWLTTKKGWKSPSKPVGYGGYWSARHITIPNVNPNLPWENIVAACGGDNGFSHGEWNCSITFDVGSHGYKANPILKCGGTTEADAIENAKRFASLSLFPIGKISCTKTSANKYGKLAPKSFKVYPGWCIFMNSKLAARAAQEGEKSSNAGTLKSKRGRISLVSKPYYYSEFLTQITKFS